ncbi:hypothetical protein [Bradyrhizobium liaoningense]
MCHADAAAGASRFGDGVISAERAEHRLYLATIKRHIAANLESRSLNAQALAA